MQRCMLIACCTFLGAAVGLAQHTVTGTVTDAENGEPLIGANVLIKGTSSGTITDIDGNFTVEVAEDDVLVFSYTGYAAQEVDVGTKTSIDVQLKLGELLEEVVVVGYGTVKARDVTGSVASLDEEKFNKGVIVSPDQLLQGRLAGVSVINNSGQPGGQATVKIRGNNSIRAGADPLYVVDGVPLDGRSARASLFATDLGSIPQSNPLNFLNPQDIASIDILKDASSAAIFGSRAANGVVLVTTKKARTNEPTINFRASTGVSSILKKYDILTADEYRDALSQYGLDGDGGQSVDAQEAILRDAITQSYSFSVGGGSDDASYRVSMGYDDIEGIVRESGIKKYNFALNTDFDLLEDRAGVDVFVVANHAEESIAPISTDAGFTGSLVGQALQWNPTIPLMTNGDFTTATNNNTGAVVGETTINPMAMLAAHNEDANTTTVLASISPHFNITDNLTYRYRYGVNYGQGTTRGNIRGWVNVQSIEGQGFAAVSKTDLLSQLHTHTLDFNTDLSSDLTFQALVGYEYQKFDFRGEAVKAEGFTILDRDNTLNLQNGDPDEFGAFSFADPISELQSYFGRVNFNLQDKYLLTATLRADGSSKFGENNEYGYFPSVAFAWKLINEDFMAGSVFDDLKLRLGWGQTGNQEFPAGAAQERFQLTSGGAIQENVANPDLKWESSTTFNIGVDFAVFDYKLSGTVAYFQRTTNDLLLDPFVQEPGPAVRAWQNIEGEVYNAGVELGLNAFLIENATVSLNVGANVSFLQNEFRDFEGANINTGNLFGQGSSGAFVQVHTNGEPLNTFRTREFIGLDDSGNSMYLNDGEPQLLGDPNADVILGFTTDLRYRDFSFTMNFNGAFGHQLYNNTAMSVIPIGNLGTRNIDASLIGGPVMESVANPISPSSRYIEDGDFLKLSNATISYDIGEIGAFNDISIGITGQNLFVITDYSGFDPEVNTVNLRNGVPSSGIEYIPYPSARTVLLNLSFSF